MGTDFSLVDVKVHGLQADRKGKRKRSGIQTKD
jgi:hypothetical protein